MRCAKVLLPDEDPAPLLVLYEQLRRDLEPQGAMEELFFDRIVAASWRLSRAHAVECGLFERALDPYGRMEQAPSFTQLLRRKFEKSCKSADALGKLSRYENSIERSLHRSLAELRRLQEIRREDAESNEKKLPNEPNSAVSQDDNDGSARGDVKRNV